MMKKILIIAFLFFSIAAQAQNDTATYRKYSDHKSLNNPVLRSLDSVTTALGGYLTRDRFGHVHVVAAPAGGSVPSIADLTILGNKSGGSSSPTTGFKYTSFNVQDFGLVGDSTTDNLSAWNAMYAIIPDGGADIYFPSTGKGYYFSGPITINKNVRVHGGGKSTFNYYLSGVPWIYADVKAGSALYFNSTTANNVVFNKSTTNHNPIIELDNLSIINLATGASTAGSGLYLDSNISHINIHDITVRNFYKNIDIHSASFVNIDNCELVAPTKVAILVESVGSVDGGGHTINNNRINSGLRTGLTTYGIWISGGGAFVCQNNNFNAQGIYDSTTQFTHQIYSDFSAGLTSDYHFSHNLHENCKREQMYLDNVNGSKVINIQVSDCQFNSYPTASGVNNYPSIYINNFGLVNIDNIIAGNGGYVSTSAAIKVRNSDKVIIGGTINVVDFAAIDDIQSSTNVSRVFSTMTTLNGGALPFGAATSGVDMNVNNSSTTAGISNLTFYPAAAGIATLHIIPHGSNDVSWALFGTDYKANQTNYRALNTLQNGGNWDISSINGGSTTANKIRLYAKSFTGQLVLDTLGNNSMSGNLSVAGGTTSDYYIAKGSNALLQFHKDASPTKAASIGMSLPGNSLTDDLIFGTYNSSGGVWTERLRLPNGGGLLTPASTYFNWGTTAGSSGYGFRDNAGTMEFKNSAGSWAGLGGGGGGTPGGSSTQIQINSSGSFSGNADLTQDATTHKIHIGSTDTDPLEIIGSNSSRIDFHMQNTNSAGNTGFILENNRGSFANYVLTFIGGSTESAAGFFGLSTRQDYSHVIADGANSAGLVIGDNNNAPIIFGTNGAERMRVTGAGVIKLGTSSTTGYVWTASGTDGSGGWAAPTGGSGVTAFTTPSGTSNANGGTVSGSNAILTYADGTNPGIMKLYTSTGSSTDGTMDRNSITTAIAGATSGTLVVVNDANYTIAAGVGTVIYSVNSVSRTITLPAASSFTNRIINIRNAIASGSDVLLSTGVIITGTATTTSSISAHNTITIQSDGTSWWVVSKSDL